MINSSFFDTLYGTEENKIRKSKKENIIYDNSFVKDMINLYSCKSLISIESYLANRLNDISKLSFNIEYKMNRITNLYSVENKVTDAMKNAGGNVKKIAVEIGRKLKAMALKVFSFFMGLVKKIKMFFNKIFLNVYTNFYEKFDPKKFTNLDAEVKNVWKGIPSNVNEILVQTENKINAEDEDALKNINSKYSEKTINKMFQYDEKNYMKTISNALFNSDELPKTVNIKVSEFFSDAKQGEKPKLLEFISPNTKKSWDLLIKFSNTKVSYLKNLSSEMSKFESMNFENPTDVQRKQKESMGKIRIANSSTKMTLDGFNIRSKIAGMIYKAAKIGCSNSKKDKNNNNNSNNDNNQ